MIRCVPQPPVPAPRHSMPPGDVWAHVVGLPVPLRSLERGAVGLTWGTDSVCIVQVEEMLQDVPVDANGNFKYQAFVKQFRKDA